MNRGDTVLKTDLLVLQALSVPSFAADGSGVVVFWNGAMEALTGRAGATVLGKRVGQALWGDARETSVEQALAQRQASEGAIELGGRRYQLKSGYMANEGETLVVCCVVEARNEAELADLSVRVLEEQKARAAFADDVGRVVGLFEQGKSDRLTGASDKAFQDIEQKLNRLLDLCTQGQAQAIETLGRLSKGEIPSKMTDGYSGDAGKLVTSINACIDGFAVLDGTRKTLERMGQNDYEDAIAIDAPGIFGDIPRDVNALREKLLSVVDYVEQVSRGDLKGLNRLRELGNGRGRRCDKDRLGPALVQMMQTLEELSTSIVGLGESIKQGKLAARIDSSRFPGVYQQLVCGMNNALDSVIGPLHVAAIYIDRISKGEVPNKITDDYKGDFNEIKNNINNCVDGLGGLVESNRVLQRLALNDYELSVQGRYVGVFAEVAQATNDVRTRMVTVARIAEEIAQGNLQSLESLKAINGGKGRRCDNDRLAPALIGMMQSIKDLVDQVVELGHAANEGMLSHRGDVQRFRGDYRQVLEGVNSTLDSVVGPLKVASSCMNEIAKGNIPDSIDGDYRGDFVEIKNSLNNCIKIMNSLVLESGRVADATAEGDLTIRGKTEGLPGKWAHIVESMNEMAGQLHDSMVHVADSVEQVSAASEEIAAGSQTVAQGASEQASALEQTSASMEQMLATTEHNVESTRQAKVLADGTTQSASKGGVAMRSMVDSMSKIRQAAEGTSGIIREINEIAFQTNLLALNAAVEAARAGDAGRGFAVVAEEVRNLAQRAKEAAKKTDQLINQSLKLAEGGQMVTEEVNGTLSEIITSVQKVSGIVAEIAMASEQQAQGIAQVNKALSEMDKVTQQNAANSEQSSAAAEELSSQAQELAAMVGRFVLERQTAAAPAGHRLQRAPAPPPRNARRQNLLGAKANGPAKLLPKRTKVELALSADDDPDFADF